MPRSTVIHAAATPARWWAAWLLALALLAVPVYATAQEAEPADPVDEAVILISVTSQHGDWHTPWQGGTISRGSGSGFLIGPGLVVTNAHVVSDARQVLVRRNGSPVPAFAGVAFIGHDTDLALLRVKDAEFDRGVKPLDIGGLPSLRSRVRTYGYPAGGEQLSRTEGVVSRVEFITYLHSGADSHLAIQTDSAINPGNSGGPVMQDGKVVGVAFQTSTRLNDVGYFIPAPVVKRFLRDIEDGRYDGYAELGLVTSDLFNEAYRTYLGLPANAAGVVVDRVLPGASATGLVREQDVITAIDGVPVALDGTIKFFGHVVQLEQIVEDKLVGETVELSLIRDRAAMKIPVKLKPLSFAERMRNQFDVQPEYVVYAGIVFTKLDQEYLQTLGNYWEHADKQLLYAHFFSLEEGAKANTLPPIVISRILPNALNSAYRGFANALVSGVNGRPVNTLAELEQALAAPRDGYQVVELDGGRKIVLDAKEAEAAHRQILEQYGIRSPRRIK